MDELAHELGLDPVELRLRNEPEKDPLTGLPFSQRGIVQAWRDGGKRFGWEKRNAPPAARRGATAHRHGLRHRHLSVLSDAWRSGALPSPAAAARPSPSPRTKWAWAPPGPSAGRGGTAGVALEQVQVLYGDNLHPGSRVGGGSQRTAAIGASVIAAHRRVKELLKLAGNNSPLAGLGPDEMGGLDGGLCALDDEGRRESYARSSAAPSGRK